MARTISYEEVKRAEYEVFQALAVEDWAAQNELDPEYPSTVRPSTVCLPEAEAKLETFIRETEPLEV